MSDFYMTDPEREPTLGEALGSFWDARYFMLVFAALGLICAWVFVSVSTPLYKGSMIIAPADGYALGDYASSVPYERMLTLPFWRPRDAEGISPDFYRFVHTTRGPSVAEILLSDEIVVSGLREDGSLLGSPEIKTPVQLSEYLSRKIRAEPIGATPLRRLVYYHPDPEFAAALLRKIHLVADQMIRRDRRRQSQSRVEYLEKALTQATNPDHRKIITNLLMQQEHVRMLANMDEPYAAIVVEPASSGSKPAWPRPLLVFPSALLAGLFLGYVVWSVWQQGRRTGDGS